MKKTIQRILITVLVFSFILVPTSKVEAAKYPYTDYLFDDTGVADTYVGHTVAVVATGTLNSNKKDPTHQPGKAVSVKVKNSKIVSAKLAKIPSGKGFNAKLDKYVVITGKKVGKTQVTVIFQSGFRQTVNVKVYPNYISKSVRVRGKKVSIGESLAQVKKDFGTKFKVIKDKDLKGKYLAYTDDMSKLLIVGICKDKVVAIYTTSSDWKSGNIGFGVEDPGKYYKPFRTYDQEVFTDYHRMSGFDDYLMNNPLKFLTHRVLSCSTSLEKKPRIYYAYEVSGVQGSSSYSMNADMSMYGRIFDLLERGAKSAAKSKGFTIQFKTKYDRFS